MNIICQDIDGNLIKTLTQWDINQKIVIKNLSLTNKPEVHFCNSHSKLALVGEATYTDGALTTEVPNILLQESLTITIYIYTTKDDGSAKTTYSIRVPVNPRPKPADYVYSDNAHFITYEELQAALAKSIEVIELATSAAKHAEQAAQAAEAVTKSGLRKIRHIELGTGETANTLKISADEDGNPFELNEAFFTAHLIFNASGTTSNLRIRADGGNRYIVLKTGLSLANGIITCSGTINAHSGILSTSAVYSTTDNPQSADTMYGMIAKANSITHNLKDIEVLLYNSAFTELREGSFLELWGC